MLSRFNIACSRAVRCIKPIDLAGLQSCSCGRQVTRQQRVLKVPSPKPLTSLISHRFMSQTTWTTQRHTSIDTSLSTTTEVQDGLSEFSKVCEQIQQQVATESTGRLFAVVYIAGKQRKVTTEDIIVLDKHIPADIGDRITINKVLLVGSKDFSLVGRPVLDMNLVRVEASVLEKTLSQTRVRFRYLKRQNNKKMRLRKERYTYLRINSITLQEQHMNQQLLTEK